jgi:hypothetical protein
MAAAAALTCAGEAAGPLWTAPVHQRPPFFRPLATNSIPQDIGSGCGSGKRRMPAGCRPGAWCMQDTAPGTEHARGSASMALPGAASCWTPGTQGGTCTLLIQDTPTTAHRHHTPAANASRSITGQRPHHLATFAQRARACTTPSCWGGPKHRCDAGRWGSHSTRKGRTMDPEHPPGHSHTAGRMPGGGRQ